MLTVAVLLAFAVASYSMGLRAKPVYEAMPDEAVCTTKQVDIRLRFVRLLPPGVTASCRPDLLMRNAAMTGTCKLQLGPENKTDDALAIQAYHYTIRAHLDALPGMTFVGSYEGYAIGRELDDLAHGVFLGTVTEFLTLESCPATARRSLPMARSN